MVISFVKNVDEINSYLCGYLKIKGIQRPDDGHTCLTRLSITGLTEEYPTLTTFFDGEIISAKNPFLTRKWDADEDVDRYGQSRSAFELIVCPLVSRRKHWSKFLQFYQFSKTFNCDNFDYNQLRNTDFVFMRWKEHFLVPDHTIKVLSL